MNEQETIADIIAAMRGGPIPQHRHDRVLLCHFADRLEAAHKREKAAIEADALAVGGIVEAARKRERGDATKLRNALNLCVDEMCARCRDLAKARGNPLPCLNGCEPVRKAKAALAEPVRNCDVGTAEEQEKRFHDFCRARHLPRMEESRYCAYKCPLEGDTCCELQWAQMPYIEKEGGAK